MEVFTEGIGMEDTSGGEVLSRVNDRKKCASVENGVLTEDTSGCACN